MRWGLQDVRVRRGQAVALDGVAVPVDPGRITVVVGGDGEFLPPTKSGSDCCKNCL